MIDFKEKVKVVITCFDRNSPYLAEELRALGFEPTNEERTAVEVMASFEECMVLNLHLRTASHVLYPIATFSLPHVKDLYRQVKSIPWEEILDIEGYFSVTSNVQNDSVDNPLFVNVKVKDAIVDRFRDKYSKRPNSGSDFLGAVFTLFWRLNEATLYINTSGETLSKHSYRKVPGMAPMLESLASSVILASGWDRRSPFVNPMCGSGTLAIEAALMASNRFPGLYRDEFAFMHITGYDDKDYRQLKKQVYLQVDDNNPPTIIASDYSQRAINAARMNAETAGVDHLIQFETCDFKETTLPQESGGILIFNPEYGQRMGEIEDLGLVYREIGDFMKQNGAGYKGMVFTGNLALGKQVGLKPARKIPFFSGQLDCRLFTYELYQGSKRGDFQEGAK
ncbi:THUMP domain-containing class I SAM-dependent RNA methyltransferase [Pleomorphovibrio marinus]|uniref:THUMP domain-containing class I SAM-dependent RNA methyltransferase n=1 Tax=Pleomorphovibrio marinus TaxID=2164132 RepID=UPI000E0C8F5E|nr:class I SAM-dependent RNA methyltransferase [Pleomorphovibrio marinus]